MKRRSQRNYVVRDSPEYSLKLSKSSAIWYFLYLKANCNAREIDTKNININKDAAAKWAGVIQNIHSPTTDVELCLKGTDINVWFPSRGLSTNNTIKQMQMLHLRTKLSIYTYKE